MNYRHAYHAGNFADVLKHTCLVALLESLKSKTTPFCYLDTHAGAGQYDLLDPEPQKTREFELGIDCIIKANKMPTLVHAYLNLVRGNSNTIRRLYPGSPMLASQLMRSQDRLILCEIQASELQSLHILFDRDKRIAIHKRDGYEALAALLPPKEKRGVVLIDPPYEAQEDEFARIIKSFETAYARWNTGVYVIWYPIKLRQHVNRFHRWFRDHDIKKTLCAEILLHPADSNMRLNGCGLLIVNAPFRFDKQLIEIVSALYPALEQSRFGAQRVEWLVTD